VTVAGILKMGYCCIVGGKISFFPRKGNEECPLQQRIEGKMGNMGDLVER